MAADIRQIGALCGHTDQVLTVAASDPARGEFMIATGSEDSTVRIWDPRISDRGRTARCLCRCFGGRPVTSVVFVHRDPQRILASAGHEVLEFDLRAGGEALLITQPMTRYSINTKDEVNQIAVQANGELLAVADDGGAITIFDLKRHTIVRSITNAHANICSAVVWRPRSSGELATGGLDSTLALWDLTRSRELGRFDLQRELRPSAASTAPDAAEALNPPLVHALSFAPDRPQLAAALGDASVAVVEWRSRSRRVAGRLCGHAAAVAAVHHAAFAPEVLLSAGNDCRLLVWRCGDDGVFVGDSAAGDGSDGAAVTAAAAAGDGAAEDFPPKLRRAPVSGLGGRREGGGGGSGGAVAAVIPAPVASARLADKPNSICSTAAPSAVVLSAGVRNEVAIFAIPG